jgi:hypothetical protein
MRVARQTVAGDLGEHRRDACMPWCVIAKRLARLLQPFFECEARGDWSRDGDAPSVRLFLIGITRGT